MNHSRIILDIEASGLGDESYPIEIAWVNRFNPNEWDSFLIKPTESWSYWDDYAEMYIHGISRELLDQDGISVVEACERLNRSLGEERVLSDAAQTDRYWLSTLYASAAVEKRFSLGGIYEVIPGDKADAFQRHLKKQGVIHRALNDARMIAKSMNFVIPQ